MMGIHQPQSELFNYQVNLDKRVRSDHPLRRINAILDLSFVRPLVAPFYGNNGNVGTDPVILVKMMLLLFLDNVASERELMAIIRERLDYLWFLGYGLDEEVPDHSVLSKARARWGREVFRQIFVRTVQQCVAAGLVDGAKLHLDSSLIRADASRDSITQGPPELVAALRQAYAREEKKLEEAPQDGINATHVSTTDPEATLARGGGTPVSQLSYKHHRAVDDAHGVITAVETTTGQAGDAAQLPGLVEQHQVHTGSRVQCAVGDKHYGSAQNYRYCQSREITAHLGQAEAYPKGIFAVSAFVYESERDRYRCPAGHYLYYHNFKPAEQLVEYKISDRALCAGCALRSKCTRSKLGRSITRPTFRELVELAQGQAKSPEARRDRARRKHIMEGSFADARNNHGFKRARWRGLWRQQIQDWLIAAIQNLRILVRKGSQLATAAGRGVILKLRAALGRLCLLLCLLAVLMGKFVREFFQMRLSTASTLRALLCAF
jgi:transposase